VQHPNNCIIQKLKSKTMFKIYSIASSVYQYQSLRKTALPITENPDGSYTGELIMNSESECLDYMKEVAYGYAESIQELQEMLEEIDIYKSLRIDAVTIRFEAI